MSTRIKSGYVPKPPAHPLPGDPPEGCTVATRDGPYGPLPSCPPWPPLSAGDEIEVEDTSMGWLYRGTVEEVRSPDRLIFRPQGLRSPVPMPEVTPGEPYRLPNLSGHALTRDWAAGAIAEVHGRHYRVIGKPRYIDGAGSAIEYKLVEATAEQYATRPGRVSIKDMADPNPTSRFYVGHNIGRVIQVGGEWLHITEVKRQRYGDAEGMETFGHITWGLGRFVPGAKAHRLQATWDARERVRSLELQLSVARGYESMATPEDIRRIEGELADARKRVRP